MNEHEHLIITDEEMRLILENLDPSDLDGVPEPVALIVRFRERAAALFREAIAYELGFMLRCGNTDKDGNLVFSRGRVAQWKWLASTPYEHLTPDEKRRERESANEVLRVMREMFAVEKSPTVGD